MILLFSFVGSSQDSLKYEEKPLYVGLGVGIDFGGFGGKLEYMFLDYGGLFVGGGYNLKGFGINGGVMLKAFPRKLLKPYLSVMYGHTGIIVIENASQYNMTDYGFSLGTGIELKTRNLNAWQLGIVLPFRSDEFRDHFQDLKDNPDISLPGRLFPIGISVGFKIII